MGFDFFISLACHFSKDPETGELAQRNINFDRISDQIAKLEKQGVIEINTLLDLPTISNLDKINKYTFRLSKADKFLRKQKLKQAGKSQLKKPPPKYRLTLDLPLTNTILLGN